ASIAGDTTDCIIGNVQVNLLSTGARGTIAYYFDALQSAETAPFQFSTGKLQRKIFAQDSIGCVDSVSLNIKDELFTNLLSGYNTIQDRDCISGNAGINLVLNPTSPSLPLSYQLNRNPASTQPNFVGLSKGGYRIRASYLACSDSVDVVIDERFPHITGFKYLHLDDCKPNNTGLKIQAEPGWGTLRYQVDNQAPQLSAVFDSLPAGSYRFQVQDSLNCVDSIRLVINTEGRAYISVEDLVQCDSASGSIAFRPNTQGIAAEYSIDGGKKWQSNPAFNALPPGIYHPLRRKPSTGCVEAALDSVVLGRHCDTLPLAYFLQKVIHISQPTELALIRWEAKAPKWYRDTFYLKMQMQGDGFPHFNDGNRANAQTPELRSAPPTDPNVYRYVGGGIHRDSVYLPLQDSAYLYTYPADYYFTLSNPLGKGVKVDPDWELTRVTVSLLGPETTPQGEEEVILCKDCVDIGKNDVTGANCYYWPDLANPGLQTQKVCKSGQYTRMALDENLKVIEKTVYTVKLSNLKVEIRAELAVPRSCNNPDDSSLEALATSDASGAFTYLWSTGETTQQIKLHSNVNEYKVTVTQQGCSAEAIYTLESSSQACEIKAYFEGKGFFAIPIEINSAPQARKPELRSDPCLENPCSGDICVQDDSGLGFKLKGKNVDGLKDIADRALKSFRGYGYNESYAFISGNDQVCSCNEYLNIAEQRFNSAKLGFWLHVFEGSECGGQDYLFVKSTVPNDHGFLQAGLDHFTSDENFDPAVALHEVAFDLMLPNFESPKTPSLFDQTPPNIPKRHEEAVEDEILCTAGFQKNSVAVIVGSGHLVMLPSNSVWRFTPNAEVAGSIFKGALVGYTLFSADSKPRIYEARWGESSLGKRYHVGFFEFGTINPETTNLSALNAISQSFALPSGTDIETYFGEHVVLSNEDGGCNLAYQIKRANINPAKGFMERPFGLLTSNRADIGTFSKEINADNGFYTICPDELAEVVEGITSGEQIDGYFSFGFTGGGMLYALNPGGRSYNDWVLVRRNEQTKQYTYYRWNCALAIWEIISAPEDVALIGKIESTYEFFQDQAQQQGLHDLLDVVGFVPFLGDVADLVNATLYLVEGDYGNAAFSLAMVIVPPGLDWAGRT
ncbi:hypothetical protein, partial [Haliscomenobacter sp.]|uniref:hypothetical protein n=1 Tax=Haliscomenobacter sp. TaxID=2717303 RepID=UPI003364D76E